MKRAYCKTCGAPRARDRKTGKLRHCRMCSYERHILRRYNLTMDQYKALLSAQGGVCAICQRAKGLSRNLAVDEDHNDSNRIRGLLCSRCNKDVLGHLRDDPEALQRAIDYLRDPPARKVLEHENI